MKNYELGNPSQMYAAIHTYLDLTEGEERGRYMYVCVCVPCITCSETME